MRDHFGREIRYMRVSVTDRCNLRCVYCMPPEGVESIPHDEVLTFDEILRICRAGTELGITRIKLTGGEPLVRKGTPALVGMLKSIPGIEQVTLTTNGTLLKDFLAELTENGLDAVNISIDTPDEKRYREVTRGGNIDRVMEGLENALRYPQLCVRINCVPLRGADEQEYIRLALLAKDKPVDVRFIEMMPIGTGKAFQGRNRDEVCALLEKEFGKAHRYNKTVGNGPAEYVSFNEFQGRIGFISAVSHRFCDRCNRIRLTSDGKLKPCLQYGAAADMKALLRKGADDSRLLETMKQVIYNKPAGHCFGSEQADETLETKGMSGIGG